MFGSKKQVSTNELQDLEIKKEKEQRSIFRKEEKTVKQLIAPGGIDASYTNHIEIASNKTRGIHISYDLDVIDPDIAPGVSVPEFDGINKEESMEICDYIIEHFDNVSSYDKFCN